MTEEQTKQLLAEGEELVKNIENALQDLVIAKAEYDLSNAEPKAEYE